MAAGHRRWAGVAGRALFACINTDSGRRFAADRIEALEFDNGMKIGVGRIDGSLYGASTIHGLTLSDPKGVFFSAPLVRVDWRPLDYLNNHVDIRSLVAPTATLARLPEFKADPAERRAAAARPRHRHRAAEGRPARHRSVGDR